MKILFVCHLPWKRELGASRVQMELAEALAEHGCEVEHFSRDEAFRSGRDRTDGLPQRTRQMLTGGFSSRARAFIEKHASRFDCIDAQHGIFFHPRGSLRFEGLLVARSVGLYPVYQQYEKHHGDTRGRVGRATLYTWITRRTPGSRPHDYVESLRQADLVNVCNRDEVAFLQNDPAVRPKVVCHPFGLFKARCDRFRSAAAAAASRLDRPVVAFVGYWSTRKGARDWPRVVRRVRERIPRVRFLFLGTGAGPAQILPHFQPEDREALSIVSFFESDQLPGLLREATVGAFPSYIEGFGFGVLEMLASGLPTVSYDVPGPREMLRSLDERLLVESGNAAAFANRLVALLRADPDTYRSNSEDAIRVARRFNWERIAADTLKDYTRALEQLRSSAGKTR